MARANPSMRKGRLPVYLAVVRMSDLAERYANETEAKMGQPRDVLANKNSLEIFVWVVYFKHYRISPFGIEI